MSYYIDGGNVASNHTQSTNKTKANAGQLMKNVKNQVTEIIETRNLKTGKQ